MAKNVFVSAVSLKGPAGSVTPADPRILVSAVNLHGPRDIRVRVSKVTLVAPPPDPRVLVSRIRLVGPNAPQRPVYYGSSSGWVPIDVYLAINGVWTRIT